MRRSLRIILISQKGHAYWSYSKTKTAIRSIHYGGFPKVLYLQQCWLRRTGLIPKNGPMIFCGDDAHDDETYQIGARGRLRS